MAAADVGINAALRVLDMDTALQGIITSGTPYHVGVFEARPGVLDQLQELWALWREAPDRAEVAAAFGAYPQLQTIFSVLTRPGQRAFVLAERAGKSLAVARIRTGNAEQVWFRWIVADFGEAVTKQCHDRNIYGHAVTVWSYA